MVKLAILVALACVAVASGSKLPVRPMFVKDYPLLPRIVGGQQAARGQFPYQVQLQLFLGHYCGGAVVNQWWIVTAAHCAENAAASYTIVANQYNKNTAEGTERKYDVQTIVRHPDYVSGSFPNDIALMKLSAPMVFDEWVQPIALPEYGHIAPHGTNGRVSGWGTTSEGGLTPIYLRFVDVPVVSDEDCRVAYPGQITDSMICAGLEEGGKDACQGDSGGPMVCDDLSEDYLCGLVSWGAGCARPGYPGVYTEVSYFSDWIEATAAN